MSDLRHLKSLPIVVLAAAVLALVAGVAAVVIAFLELHRVLG